VQEVYPPDMLTIVGWFFAILATMVPAYMIWAYGKRATELNQRIAECDPTLLTDGSVNVSRLMAVPEGSQYLENAEIVMVPVAPAQVEPQTGNPY
tara:strand:+ start:1007 stop:1291 length:285 start_codon:yes stop_codon:yes gene_type:complete